MQRLTRRAGLPGFPAQHRTKLHSTKPLERLKKKVKRGADVVGIFPNEDSIVRLQVSRVSLGTFVFQA